MPDASISQVRAFFAHDKLTDFRDDWAQLDDESKAQIRAGIGDGSYNY